MPLTRFRRAPLLLHPTVLALVTWTMVGGLYLLHLSDLLLFSSTDVLPMLGLIVLPVVGVSLCFWIVYRSQRQVKPRRTVILFQPDIANIEHRLKQCLFLWVALSIIETIVSGGVPLVWLMTGSSKNYFDYGIPSVHGLVIALLLALAATSFALYLFTGKRSYCAFPIFSVFWCFVLITRGTIMILILECILLYLRFRRIRWTSFLKLGVLFVVLLVVFGIVGDYRSGAAAFRALAQPTAAFPDWAPSGLLWAYIYITTPINNLLYSTHVLKPLYDWLLPNTALTLLPSVLRNIVYGKEGAQAAISGGLVVEALNVSTAYVGPYQDLGRWGIAGYSTMMAVACEVYWRRNGFRNTLIFAVFAQTLILSLFFNLFFSLPILGQLVWFVYFTPKQQAELPSKERGLEKVYV